MISMVIDVLEVLWPFLLVAAALLSFVGPIVRLIFFVIGLVFFLGLEQIMDLGGPDSPGLILPFGGLCVSAAGVLAEILTRLARWTRNVARARPSARPQV